MLLKSNSMWKHLATGSVLAAGVFAYSGQVVSAQGQNGTTLSDATKTAEGFYERRINYDWSVQKVANPTSLTLDQGETSTVSYQITTNRVEASRVDVVGARGEICVTNGGAVATENLNILDVVQTKV